MPIEDTKKISNQVLNAFQYVGQITSIKPLMFEGTTVCSDQWLMAFETTEDSDLLFKIPRSTHISNHKITTKWREAPKICFYCKKEVLQEKEQTDETTDTKDTTLQCISEDEEMMTTDATLEITNNEKATTTNSTTSIENMDNIEAEEVDASL
ncbi:17622_t:CDS:2 [Cetraspora pellucida]|uniref:17622_t:CDS:1 n=1 Tax=Cetraspora pellucida TaxID=1433469 RepID=A0ACA9LHB7_9GLOM|nr:17622_t:CDS:2 [Cetraspora pellucida]